MPKAKVGVPADKLALYEKLVATHPQAERKGVTMPYTAVNGNMFSFLTPTGTLALRLSTPERDAFLAKYATKLCEQHGAVLQEYVEVPDALLARTEELQPYFNLSYAYVAALKPKASSNKGKVSKQQ